VRVVELAPSVEIFIATENTENTEEDENGTVPLG